MASSPKTEASPAQVASADADTGRASDEDEIKAATRLKRIKQLIAEKKGVISSNMKDSLREIVKKYPTTAAAKEARKLLDE